MKSKVLPNFCHIFILILIFINIISVAKSANFDNSLQNDKIVESTENSAFTLEIENVTVRSAVKTTKHFETYTRNYRDIVNSRIDIQSKSGDTNEDKKPCILGTSKDYLWWLNDDGSLAEEEILKLDYTSDELFDESNSYHDTNTLYDITKNQSVQGLAAVVFISIANSNLTLIPRAALSFAIDTLEYLSLYGNNLTTYCCVDLPEFSKLKVLDLRASHISYLSDNSFYKLDSLEMLFMSHNEFFIIVDIFFNNLPNLIHLDISYNTRESDDVFNSGLYLGLRALKSVRFLDLSYSRISVISLISLNALPRSIEAVSLCFTSIRKASFEPLEYRNLSILDISGNLELGRIIQMGELNLLSNKLEVLAVESNNIGRLSWLSEFKQLQVLHLKYNNIIRLDSSFSELESINRVDLSFNVIRNWDDRIFRNNRLLSMLKLDNNHITTITSAMLEDLARVDYLSMGNNNFICDCALREFFKLATTKNRLTFVDPQRLPGIKRSKFSPHRNNDSLQITSRFQLLDLEENNYQCFNFSNDNYYNLNSSEYCPSADRNKDSQKSDKYEITIGQLSIVLMVPIICAVLGWLLYLNWWYIRYTIVVVKNAAVFSYLTGKQMREENAAGNGALIYDVFVSYCDENRDWVIEELLPNIEGHRDINVCLHERDFQVGLSILENIIACMDQSRCIFLIVTKQFLMSSWCQFEMHLAQHRLIAANSNQLVLIFLEDIPKRKRSRTLQYLMYTKTYIKWPNDDKQKNPIDLQAERQQFWKRLKRSLM